GGEQNGSRARLVDRRPALVGERRAVLVHAGVFWRRIGGPRTGLRSAGQSGAGGALPDARDLRTDRERDPRALRDRLRGLVRGAAPGDALARAPAALAAPLAGPRGRPGSA